MTYRVKQKSHQIKETIRRFTEKFNGDDLDGAMEFFAEDSLYVEYNGTQHHGKQTIRNKQLFISDIVGGFRFLCLTQDGLFDHTPLTGKAFS